MSAALSAEDKDAEPKERQFTARQLLAQLWPYFREQKPVLLRAVLLLFAMSAADLAGPQILRLVLNDAIALQGPSRLAGLAALFLGLTVFSLVMNWHMTLLLTRGGLAIVTSLKERLFRHVLGLNIGFFQVYTPGRLLARVESDTENLKQLFSQAAIRLTHSVVIFLGVMLVMLFEDAAITGAVLLCMLVMAALARFFLGRVRMLWRESRRRYTDISGFVTEYVGAVDVIQHYGYEPAARARLSELGARKMRADSRANVMDQCFWGLFQFFETAAAACVVAVGARRILNGTMDVGTLVMFLEYLRQVFMPIFALSEFVNLVQRSMVSAERVFGILHLERDDQRWLGAADGGGTEQEVPFAQAVRFEGVSFAYEPGREVLRNVSFEIRRGQKIAVVGPSGGGKSTLANLLLHLYEPLEGRITVDGADLRTYSRRAWRRKLGLVLQGVHLFPGSLRDNLTVFDPGCDEERIRTALRTVQAEALVQKLPGGLEAQLAERGANLSLGERQLVSFARALVHDPPLLVLDEATSSVDPATERRIQESLDRMLAGRTAFIIAHRLSTIMGVDRILVVLDGRIAEEGTHAELYARGGAYRKLFDLQFHAVAGQAGLLAKHAGDQPAIAAAGQGPGS